MKKSLLVIASCLTLSSAFAEGEKTVKAKVEKEPISNGFYLHLGLGFLGSNSNVQLRDLERAQSLGAQVNFEIGNQWYFVKNDNFGIGLKVSWLQLGYGQGQPSARPGFAGYDNKTGTFDLRLLQVGPQFSLAIGDKSALDLYANLSPTLMISANRDSDQSYGQVHTGLLVVPGARFRFGKFAVGADVSVGRLSSAYDFNGTNTTFDVSNPDKDINEVTYKTSVLMPRVYVGFKF